MDLDKQTQYPNREFPSSRWEPGLTDKSGKAVTAPKHVDGLGNRLYTASRPEFHDSKDSELMEDLIVNGRVFGFRNHRRNTTINFSGKLFDEIWYQGADQFRSGFHAWAHPFLTRRRSTGGELVPFTIGIGNSAGQILDGMFVSMLIPPSSMNVSFSNDFTTTKTRLGVVVSASIPDPISFSFSGKSPAFITMSEGLATYRTRMMSTAYMQLASLQAIFKNNGGNAISYERIFGPTLSKQRYKAPETTKEGEGATADKIAPNKSLAELQEKPDPSHKSMIVGTLDNPMIEFDGTLYYGHFNSFSFKEDANNPYLIEFDFDFKVMGVFGDIFDGHVTNNQKVREDGRIIVLNRSTVEKTSSILRDYSPTISPETIGLSRADLLGVLEQRINPSQINVTPSTFPSSYQGNNRTVKEIEEIFKKGVQEIRKIEFYAQRFRQLLPGNEDFKDDPARAGRQLAINQIDFVGTVGSLWDKAISHSGRFYSSQKTSTERAKDLYKSYKALFDQRVIESGVPLWIIMLTAIRESGGNKDSHNIFGVGAHGETQEFKRKEAVPQIERTFTMLSYSGKFAEHLHLYNLLLKTQGVSPDQAAIFYLATLQSVYKEASITGAPSKPMIKAGTDLVTYGGSNFVNNPGDAQFSYIIPGGTGTAESIIVSAPAFIRAFS